MSKKRIFLLWLKPLILIALLFVFVFIIVMPQYTTYYTAGLLDKVARLREVGSPKIVLVGNSNVAFGFDSEKIQNAFGLPVTNMGLHGGLGPAFSENMTKPYIGNGDIIVLLPADFSASLPNIYNYPLAWLTIENHWHLWKGIAPSDYLGMIKAFPSYWGKAFSLWMTRTGNQPLSEDEFKSNQRKYFNEYGDIAYPRPAAMDHFGSDPFYADITPAMVDYWNQFNEYATNRGAFVYMSYFPIYENTLGDFEMFQNKLHEQLSFPLVSDFHDYLYPLSFFYDTYYHLNDHGVQVRTEQLIKDLSAYVPLANATAAVPD